MTKVQIKATSSLEGECRSLGIPIKPSSVSFKWRKEILYTIRDICFFEVPSEHMQINRCDISLTQGVNAIYSCCQLGISRMQNSSALSNLKKSETPPLTLPKKPLIPHRSLRIIVILCALLRALCFLSILCCFIFFTSFLGTISSCSLYLLLSTAVIIEFSLHLFMRYRFYECFIWLNDQINNPESCFQEVRDVIKDDISNLLDYLG